MFFTIGTRSALMVCAAVLAVACGRDPNVAKREYLARGDSFLAEKKYPEAIVEYRNSIKQDDKFGDARYKLAEAYAASGDLRGAYREYIRAADLLTKNTEAQLKAASYLLLAGQFEDAKTRAQLVLDRDATNVEALLVRGKALAGLKDLDGALVEVEEAIKLSPDRGATYTDLAVVKLAQGRRDEARAAFEKAVEIDPKSIPALLALAIFQWSVGDPAASELTLSRVLEIDSKHAFANRTLAAIYLTTNRAAEAERPLRGIVEATQSDESRFVLADYYIARKRPEDAKKVLEPMAAEPATLVGATSRLAQLEYLAGQRSEAHVRLDALLVREPKNASLHLMKARWLLAEDKRPDALASAAAAVKSAPDSVAGHYLLGTVQAMMLDNEAAAASFKEVLRLNPRIVAAQLQLSRLEFTRGNVDRAVELAEGALKDAPGTPVARLIIARGLIARRDMSRAEPAIASLLKQYPNVAMVHAADGSLRLAKNDVPGARTAFERALALDSKSLEAIGGLTAVDILQKKIPDARARVQASLAADPNGAELLILAARVHMAEGDVASAERMLRRVIEVAPADTRGYMFLAQVYLRQKKLDAARAEFDGIVSRRPDDIGSRTMAAIIVHSQNNLTDAKKRYEEIIELDRRAHVAANNLASIYADEGFDLDRALRLAETAAQGMPTRAEVQDTIGWIYIQKELPSLAIPPLERGVAMDPSNPTYYYHLGLAYLKAGQRAKARTSLQTALKLQPNFAQASEARKALDSL